MVTEAALGALPKRLWEDRESGRAGCQWHIARWRLPYGLDSLDRALPAVLS